MEKTELQKMLFGELYDAGDPELQALNYKAKGLIFQLNNIPYEDEEARGVILKKLLKKLGKNSKVLSPFFCDYGRHISIGSNFFSNFNCMILDCAEVEIGNNVMFGPNVQLYTAYHPLLASERIKGPELAAPIKVGNNVWVGGGAIICQNITIGDNTTIGAGSVVTKSIPDNVFAAGNPCRVIKEL